MPYAPISQEQYDSAFEETSNLLTRAINADIERAMLDAWIQIKDYKPDYIYMDGVVEELGTEHMEFWGKVMNPNIYQLFPALKRKP